VSSAGQPKMPATKICRSGRALCPRMAATISETLINLPFSCDWQLASGVSKVPMGGCRPPQRCPVCAQRKLAVVPANARSSWNRSESASAEQSSSLVSLLALDETRAARPVESDGDRGGRALWPGATAVLVEDRGTAGVAEMESRDSQLGCRAHRGLAQQRIPTRDRTLLSVPPAHSTRGANIQ
jgi:hypothetical protein